MAHLNFKSKDGKTWSGPMERAPFWVKAASIPWYRLILTSRWTLYAVVGAGFFVSYGVLGKHPFLQDISGIPTYVLLFEIVTLAGQRWFSGQMEELAEKFPPPPSAPNNLLETPTEKVMRKKLEKKGSQQHGLVNY